MANDDSLALERAYYLPLKDSTSESYWTKNANSQDEYADLCQRGHTIIANQIITGIQNGQPPTVFELYKTAARIRRAIAWQLRQSHSDAITYGQPALGPLRDFVGYKGRQNSRWATYGDLIYSRFNALAALIKAGEFHKAFGDDYEANINGTLSDEAFISISCKGLKSPIAQISYERTFIFCHSGRENYPALFEMANNHFAVMLKNRNSKRNDTKFWQEMGAISLDLFHAAPLALGSQTATLMVLAGITKAMGYEVVPRTIDLDHFLAAELTPYKEYMDEFGKHFSHSPARMSPPEKSLPVDETFIQFAWQTWGRTFFQPSPIERLQRYINVCLSLPFPQGPIGLLDIRVKDGRIETWAHPHTQQENVDYALDFIGHDELINVLDLAQEKHTDRVRRSDSTERGSRGA